MHNLKSWLKNILLFIFSLTLVLLIGEWLFPKYLNKLPFRLYGGVKNELRILAQYSKHSVLPENYIAIVGDSNSVGVGDLYKNLTKNSKNWYPDYSPAHFINKAVGVDVVSFGLAGAGSFQGIWSEPVNQFKYINSLGFDLKPPKTVLVLFYEGNDIGNNLQLVRESYKGSEAIQELNHFKKFNSWLNLQFENSFKENYNGFFGNLIFTNFIFKSIKNIFLENLNKKEKFDRIIFPATPFSQATMNGETVPLPVHLMAPPLFGVTFLDKKHGYNDDSLRIGYYIFERAIEKIKKFFSNSEIKVVYLPSTLASYELISSTVSFRGNMGDFGIVATKKLNQRHLEVCQKIMKITQGLEVGFFDSTKYLLDASSKTYIHGPIDWDHLNESGYRALSHGISQFVLHPNDHYQNCKY